MLGSELMKIYGIIYVIRNKVNNKLYIGQTTEKGGFDRRYRHDLFKNTHNKHLKSSIQKYGIENFEIDKEFDIAYSKDELDRLEDMYIKIYDCIDNGYNDKTGGSNGKPSEETKQKIGRANRGKHHTEEAKQRMSEAKKGKHLTEEHKQKLSEIMKGKLVGENNPVAKKVICVTTQEVFNTMTEAGKAHSIKNVSHISKVCIGEQHSCGKLQDGTPLVWMYYDEYLESSKDIIEEKIYKSTTANSGKNNPKSKKVICITTKEVFETITEGSKKYNISRQTLTDCCRHRRESAGNINGIKLVWMYYDEYLQQKDVA